MILTVGIILGVLLAVFAQTLYSLFLFPKRAVGGMLGRLSREGKRGAIYAACYAHLVKTCPFMSKNQLHAGAVKMTDRHLAQLRLPAGVTN